MCKPFTMARDVMPCLFRLRGALVIAGTTFGFISNAIAQNIQLGMPIACELGRTCYIQNYVDIDPSPSAKDYKCGTLTYDKHDGTDFRVPSLEAQNAGVKFSPPRPVAFSVRATARQTAFFANRRERQSAMSNAATAS